MISELAEDYSNYLKVDVKKELEPVEETIEDMLTRLEEFETLVNMIRSDGSQCLDSTIPSILSRQGEFDVLCSRVDDLERLVARVKHDVAGIETQLDKAEAELGASDSTFKNIFKPLFFRRSESGTLKSPGAYHAAEVFNTTDFFPSHDSNEPAT